MSKAGAGLTATLFGRFVTSDLLARVDAPVHVAHAFTVHAANTEMDYFTVVDDLNRDDETGAAHANQAELGAGVYYGHVAVDVPLLISNLSGSDRGQWRQQDRVTACLVLEALVRSIASRSPGAKLGSTAPYSRAELVLLEVGTEHPRTLANAFLEALPARGHLLQAAADRMAAQLVRIDAMYGPTANMRTLATTLQPTAFAPLSAQPLDAASRGALAALWA
jgi:CRISPR system Cascade subunit CasC